MRHESSENGMIEFAITTADIKDMYVEPPARASRAMEVKAGGRDMVPFLEVLDGLVKRGIEVRLIHAKDPGPNWRDYFDRYPTLWTAMERMLCPRVHFKCIIVDGVKDDPALVNPLVEQFDSVWRGAFCRECGRREHCPDPVV